jgi:NAD(P)-dependent dehydrogenase (short-subunit alcohol dehydrogenase family)
MDLSNSVAIVTGAGSGIGASVARKLLDGGATVALLGRRAAPLRDVAAGAGDRAVVRPLDVSDAAAVKAAVAEIVDAIGTPNLLVNSAGIAMPERLEAIEPEVWDEVIAINLSGSFYMAREVAMRMQKGGSIVNLGSEQSHIGMALFVHYGASKAGVTGMTRAMALELAPRGIRVNAVCPGPVDTPMVDGELAWFDDSETARQEGIERVPLKRWATPDEIADMVLFVGVSAVFATGSCFSIDGGTVAG